MLDKQQNRAKVSVSRVGFKALALMSNDSIVPYLVPLHEQVLAHISQAKNYIFLKDLEAASVEMRVAQGLQREIELAHQKELERKKDKVKKPATEGNPLSALDEAFIGLDPIAGKIKNSYQNAYAFYMAANLWETLGEYDKIAQGLNPEILQGLKLQPIQTRQAYDQSPGYGMTPGSSDQPVKW